MSEAEALAALEGKPMEERTHKLFTTREGDVRMVGNYGQASNDVPVLVPEHVAREFASTTLFRVEAPERASKKKER